MYINFAVFTRNTTTNRDCYKSEFRTCTKRGIFSQQKIRKELKNRKQLE
jgi:hypothetical protein